MRTAAIGTIVILMSIYAPIPETPTIGVVLGAVAFAFGAMFAFWQDISELGR